jgi:glycosyltransferase involved in cell wall biosynthesis
VSSRLLVDVGPAEGEDGSRGIGRYVRGLVQAMATWPPERRERIWAVGLSGQSLATFGARGVDAPWLGLRPLDMGWLLGAEAIRRSARRSHASAFHATDPHRPWRSRRVSQVVTAYDLIPFHDEALLATWRPHHRWVYRRYLRQLASADQIVAISQATARDLTESLGIGEDRISVVYPVVGRPASTTRTPSTEPTFLFVGAPDPHKQPELAVQALGSFRELHRDGILRFVGPSSRRQRLALHAEARRLGIAEHLRFDGWLTDKDLDRAFETAMALLFTSRIEGFGLPAVEAALRGVPVIAVETPAARETIATVARLTTPDAEAIAAAMAAPLAPEPAALSTLADRFSTAATADALWAVYERALT